MADPRCLQRVEILKIEGLGLFRPLWQIVIASGGSKSSKEIEDLGLIRVPCSAFRSIIRTLFLICLARFPIRDQPRLRNARPRQITTFQDLE